MSLKLNKSQAIRDTIAAYPDCGPTEIAEHLTKKKCRVTAQYVSSIKFADGAKNGRRVRVRRPVSNSPISAALEFIQAAGGLEEAKGVLLTLEEIGKIR